jgi:predicted small integral membrane protein
VILRTAKLLLVCGMALAYTLIVLDNLTDYDSNYQFVRHVLLMDSTFPGNHLLWRAIQSPAVHTAFYATIIAWEAVTMALLWVGAGKLFGALRKSAGDFHLAKKYAIAGLGASLMMWLVAFLIVGGDWFLMWQSRTWNGLDAAFRMFAVAGIILLLVAQRDEERQP